jgi:hypothetical protein
VADLLDVPEAAPALTRLLPAQQNHRVTEQDKRPEPNLLPLADLRRAILGSVVNLLAQKLPADAERLSALLKDGHDALARQVIMDGLRGAEQTIGEYLQRALKQTTILVKTLRDGK